MYFNRNLEVTNDGGCLPYPEEWGDFHTIWRHCSGWELSEETVKTPKHEIILREDVSLLQAREGIIDFLKHNSGEIFISELIQKLRIDLDLVIEVLEQLYDEGYIDRTD